MVQVESCFIYSIILLSDKTWLLSLYNLYSCLQRFAKVCKGLQRFAKVCSDDRLAVPCSPCASSPVFYPSIVLRRLLLATSVFT